MAIETNEKPFGDAFHETGFGPIIYYIATTLTIQEFKTKKMLGQQQKKK
jgi:hypothetical protein